MAGQKIDLTKHITLMLEELKEIETSDADRREKTRKIKALGKSFKNDIFYDQRRFGGKRAETKRIKPKTLASYLSRARAEVDKLGMTHHLLERSLGAMKRACPANAVVIEKLEGLGASELRQARKEMIDSLGVISRELPAQLSKLDFSKKAVGRDLDKIRKQYPLYSELINNLLTGDAREADVQLQEAISELPELLNRLHDLKTDHQLLYELQIDKATKYQNAMFDSRSLDRKKGLSVKLDYKAYLQSIKDILNNPEMFGSGDTIKDIAPVVFALCAVTGRRPIEILYQGEFETINECQMDFSGQAKKRDDSQHDSYSIYTLVDTELVESALAFLNGNERVARLLIDAKAHVGSSINMDVANKTSNTLNVFAKDFFDNKDRTVKDTRSIYARICLEKFYRGHESEIGTDEDRFLKSILGHDSDETQLHYKKFHLVNFDDDFIPADIKIPSRLEKLEELADEVKHIARDNIGTELLDIVKNEIREDPGVKINQTMLNEIRSTNRATLKRFLDTVSPALGLEQTASGRWVEASHKWPDMTSDGEPLDDDFDDDDIEEPIEPSPVKPKTGEQKAKPRITPKKKPKPPKPRIHAENVDDKYWLGVVKLDGEILSTAKGKDRNDAMRKAWARYEEDWT